MQRLQSVFIVDDDDFFRKALHHVFYTAGFLVEDFASAELFLTGYKPCQEACLILDLRMPEIGGLALLQCMRQRGIDLPVIICTGNADVPVSVRAMQEGVFSVLEKPLSSELLIEQVRAAIAATRRKRSRQAEIRAAKNRLASLTEREREIAAYLSEGFSAPVLAAKLALSTRTIEAHRNNILRKLEIKSIAILVRLVLLAEFDDQRATQADIGDNQQGVVSENGK